MRYVRRGAARALFPFTGVALLASTSACSRVDYSKCLPTDHVISDDQPLPGGLTVNVVLDNLIDAQVQGYWDDGSPVDLHLASTRAEGPATYRTIEYGRSSIFSGFGAHREQVLYLEAHDTGRAYPGTFEDTGSYEDCNEYLTVPIRQALRTLDGAVDVAIVGKLRTYLWEGMDPGVINASFQATALLDATHTVPEPAAPAAGDTYLRLTAEQWPGASSGYLQRAVTDGPGEPLSARSSYEVLVSWY